MSMLGYVDYIVFAVILFLSLSIGIYYSRTGGKQRTIEEYLTGNRRISCLPIALSLLVTFQSGISLLGLPVEIYHYGTQISMGIIGLVLGYTFVAIFLVPVFHPLQLTSAYEYLEMRFQSRFVRLLGCTLGLLFTVTYMAVALFIPALALEAVTGFPVLISVIVTSVVVVGYTMLGGIKAVVWTDVLQFIVMIAGILTLLVKGCIDAGGVQNVWNISQNGNRLEFFNLDPNPTTRQTLWAVTIGSITSWMGNAISQSGIQRICSTPSIREARKAILFNIPAALLYEGVMAFMGLVIFAYYTQKGCDPTEAGYIKSSNQLVPYFMMEHLSFIPGLAGLFVACLFSATLSTLSSGLSAISAIVWEDYLDQYCNCIPRTKASLTTKILVAIFGAIIVGLSFLAMNLKGTITQITIGSLAATSGPLLGVFLLGAVFPWATSKSTVIGGFLSFCFILAMSLGSNFYPMSHPTLPPVTTDGCSNTSVSWDSNNTTMASNTSIGVNSSYTSNFSSVTATSFYKGTNDTGHFTTTGVFNETLQDNEDSIPWIFKISFWWYHLMGVLGTMIIGTILTILTGGMTDIPAEPRFLIPCIRSMKCYQRHFQLQVKRQVSDYVELRASFRGKEYQTPSLRKNQT